MSIAHSLRSCAALATVSACLLPHLHATSSNQGGTVSVHGGTVIHSHGSPNPGSQQSTPFNIQGTNITPHPDPYRYSTGFGHSQSLVIVPFRPPEIPILGDPINGSQESRTFDLPWWFRTYQHEIFAPQLHSQLRIEGLRPHWRQQFETYRDRRDKAVRQLRHRIESTRTLEPQVRRRTLEEFARTQAAEVSAIEAKADRLRDLLVPVIISYDGDDIHVFESALYYQRGLSPAQQDLLREIILELTPPSSPTTAETSPDRLRVLSFSPAPARFRLPPQIPEDLAHLLDRYQAAKDALKHELKSEIVHVGRSGSSSRRVSAFESLAERQAPDFAHLEELAEEIRWRLETVPGVTPLQTASNLPVPLVERIGRYLEKKAELQDELTLALNQLRARHPDERFEFARAAGGLNLVRASSGWGRRHRATAGLEQELAEFNAKHHASLMELDREKDGIEAAVRQFTEALQARAPTYNLDQLLREFAATSAVQQQWARYADYRDAVLLPGLAPAQRRLLFGAGMLRLSPSGPAASE
jgi:hypothetical protein